MRWDTQSVRGEDAAALPGLERLSALTPNFSTPDFTGASFLEVAAKSALNRVPSGSGPMADAWTINPYRGCQHACRYCFARDTHRYLDLDTGADFDNRIVVKTNIGAVLASELRGKRRDVTHVQLGTNTDPYQRAEGRYRLMPEILSTLADHGIAISILTKGTLLRRDLPLLAELSQLVPVSVAISIAIFDDELQRAVEPGTPSARARLATVRAVRAAGLECSVFVMPVLPGLTDTTAQLDLAFRSIAEAGASSVVSSSLHLRPGAREWYLAWLREEHPELLPMYAKIYRGGSYARKEYRDWLRARSLPLQRSYGLVRGDTAPGTGINGIRGARASAAGPSLLAARAPATHELAMRESIDREPLGHAPAAHESTTREPLGHDARLRSGAATDRGSRVRILPATSQPTPLF